MNNPCKRCELDDIIICEFCEKATSYQRYLEKKRRYKKSNIVIDSVEKLLKTEWIWWGHKPIHRTFLTSMPFRTVIFLIGTKNLYAAELKQKPID